MSNSKSQFKSAKNKLEGTAKEIIGKATNNEELELKGKIQTSTADLTKKIEGMKDVAAGTVNHIIERKRTTERGK